MYRGKCWTPRSAVPPNWQPVRQQVHSDEAELALESLIRDDGGARCQGRYNHLADEAHAIEEGQSAHRM